MTGEPTPESGESTLNFNLDRSNLYLEESYTDLKVGTVKRFTPVLPDGSVDKSRKTYFLVKPAYIRPMASYPFRTSFQPRNWPRPSNASRGHENRPCSG